MFKEKKPLETKNKESLLEIKKKVETVTTVNKENHNPSSLAFNE